MLSEQQHSLFKNYLKKLDSIRRFSEVKKVRAPHNDWVGEHTRRILIMLSLYEDKLKKYVDVSKAKLIALLHDMPEIVTGDISTLRKIEMNEEEKRDLERKELDFYRGLKQELGNVNGWDIEELGLDCINKQSPEAKLVKLLDVIDGLFYTFTQILPNKTNWTKTGRTEEMYNYFYLDKRNVFYWFDQVKPFLKCEHSWFKLTLLYSKDVDLFYEWFDFEIAGPKSEHMGLAYLWYRKKWERRDKAKTRLLLSYKKVEDITRTSFDLFSLMK